LTRGSTNASDERRCARSVAERYGGPITRWGATLVTFAFVQGLVLLLSALAGLLIVRELSKSEYAFFAIINVMISCCNLLTDLGVSIGLRSIGGRIWKDPFRSGQLVKTVLELRSRFATCSLAVCLPVVFWMLLRNDSGLRVAGLLSLCLVAAAIPLFGSGVWLPVVQLHGEFKRLQRLDLATGIARLGSIALLAAVQLNAISCVLIGAAVNWVQMSVTRTWAFEKLDPRAEASEADRREILALSKRWIPNVLFFCVQGQLTVFILTLLHNPLGIADLTALGRIAALFTICSVTVSNVLTPRFARCQEPSRLSHLYLLIVGSAGATLALVICLAWMAPGSIVWLLGPRYAGLERECVLVVTAGSLAQLGTVMFTLNSSRGWIRYQSVAFIPSILGVQIIATMLLDLNVFRQVLLFQLLSAAAPIPVYALDSWSNLRARSRFTDLSAKRTSPS
jgi:hypothetical protein